MPDRDQLRRDNAAIFNTSHKDLIKEAWGGPFLARRPSSHHFSPFFGFLKRLKRAKSDT
jgi:hypothetical protein